MSDWQEKEFRALSSYLGSQGLEPELEWTGNFNSKSSVSPGRITLKRGPIRTVELHLSTEVTKEDGPNDKPGEPVEWKTTVEIRYTVKPDWDSRVVPGLLYLKIHRTDSPINPWHGNDIGLGIIDSLKADPSLATLVPGLTIEPDMFGTRHDARPPGGDPHALVKIRQLNFGYTRAATYGLEGAPSIDVPIPNKASWQAVQSVAEQLVSRPEFFPDEYPMVTDFDHVSAPRTSYLAPLATLAFALAVGAAGGGLFTADWTWIHRGWLIFFGIVLVLLGAGGVLFALSEFRRVISGCNQIGGIVNRMWRASFESLWPWSGKQHQGYIRIGRLPFKVSDSLYDSLTEGEHVTGAFWPGDKDLSRLDRTSVTDQRAENQTVQGG